MWTYHPFCGAHADHMRTEIQVKFDHERIVEAMDAQGRSQQWLAQQTHYHQTTISRYLNGLMEIPESMGLQIAALLGIPVRWLISDDDPMHAPPNGAEVDHSDEREPAHAE